MCESNSSHIMKFFSCVCYINCQKSIKNNFDGKRIKSKKGNKNRPQYTQNFIFSFKLYIIAYKLDYVAGRLNCYFLLHISSVYL